MNLFPKFSKALVRLIISMFPCLVRVLLPKEQFCSCPSLKFTSHGFSGTPPQNPYLKFHSGVPCPGPTGGFAGVEAPLCHSSHSKWAHAALRLWVLLFHRRAAVGEWSEGHGLRINPRNSSCSWTVTPLKPFPSTSWLSVVNKYSVVQSWGPWAISRSAMQAGNLCQVAH